MQFLGKGLGEVMSSGVLRGQVVQCFEEKCDEILA